MVANLMFDLAAINISTKARTGGDLWFSEVVATLGLLLVIFGVVRSGRAALAPFAVAGYIAAAYWFTSSTSFANPAVTIARTLQQHVRRHQAVVGRRRSSSRSSSVARSRSAVAWFLYPDLPADAVVVPHDARRSRLATRIAFSPIDISRYDEVRNAR